MAGKIDSRLMGMASPTTLGARNTGNQAKSATSERAHALWMKVKEAVHHGRIHKFQKAANAVPASSAPALKEDEKASNLIGQVKRTGQGSPNRKPRPNRLSLLLPDHTKDPKPESPQRLKSPHVVRHQNRSPELALRDIGLSIEDIE